ncbi:protein-disulfide reductase DsbD [Candidatus Rariloculus sp.]|uniref:protein-disulfide reductase DsbD n=1 Tax=Candidatus Rariloculus sp. TaxID=3101265 RepID=UPI003D136906
MHPRTSLLALLAAVIAGATTFDLGAQEQEVLHPREAFPYTVEADTDRVLLSFDVPDGYYLYRERFGFESATSVVSLGAAEFPAGNIYEDEFFGVQEIYRGRFDISIPYEQSSAVRQVELELKLQGCADIGLCYPPQRWTNLVQLPPGGGAAAGSSSLIFGAPDDTLLPVDEAFVMNARFDGANELTVAWQIAPGHYLYSDKLGFEVDGSLGLGTARLPAGEPHYDENFGDVEVFYDYVEATIPFSRASPDEMPVTIRAQFQGCRENSICYPPGEQTMALVLPAASEFASAIGNGDVMVSEQDRLAALVLSDSWLIVLGTFYGLGLLLAFTPCVLPMVPILSGIIAGQGKVTAGRGFALSFSYVMGMAVTYTAAGALAALAGEQIQAIFQKPWIITAFAGLFVVLALGMFGLFELQMPAAIQTRMANLANRQKTGTFAGTAVIGALSALIVTTCVAPPLVATLAVIGQSGDVVRGAGALFALSLGMGSPLLLVGASAGKLLPHAGPWMNFVKAGFGVMMLGLAIWMMERVLPGSVTLVLWALLVFLTGVFLGAFEPLPQQPAATKRLSKGVGVLACLYGALMLIGATLGGQNPLRPLPPGALMAVNGLAAQTEQPDFQEVETVAALDSLLAEARAAGRPVMVDFTAEWCVSCREMEEYTFPNPAVVAALEPFTLLRADVTANDDDDQALLERFNSYGPPTIAFFDRQGLERGPFKLVGYVPAAEFTVHVERVAAL